MWLWAGHMAPDDALVRTLWQAYLRRFGIEHLFRLLKQRLGWDKPLLRSPEAADRWTWLVIAAVAQLWPPAASPPSPACPGSHARPPAR